MFISGQSFDILLVQQKAGQFFQIFWLMDVKKKIFLQTWRFPYSCVLHVWELELSTCNGSIRAFPSVVGGCLQSVIFPLDIEGHLLFLGRLLVNYSIRMLLKIIGSMSNLYFGIVNLIGLYFLASKFTIEHNRGIHKVRKRQHQYLEFGHHTQGEIQKKPAKKYISIQGRWWGWNWGNHQYYFWWFLEFHPVFHFFPERLHCCYIDFIAPTRTATIIPLEPCALNAEIQHFVLSFSISYWDLIKFPYFVVTTKRGVRGWKEAQRQNENRVILWILHIVKEVVVLKFFSSIRSIIHPVQLKVFCDSPSSCCSNLLLLSTEAAFPVPLSQMLHLFFPLHHLNGCPKHVA